MSNEPSDNNSATNPPPSRIDRLLRSRRSINDEQFTSLFVNLIRAALPFARPCIQALDIVLGEETENAGDESDTELDETDTMDAAVPNPAALARPGGDDRRTPSYWYAVARGTHVGVFHDL